MSVFDGKWTWNGSGSSVVNGLLHYADRKRVRSSSGGGGGAADVRRERGMSWFSRQLAQPVDLPHPLLHDGLRFGDVALICGCARSGKSELAYLVAACHAVTKGGRVVWVTAPGAKAVQPRRLAAHLEREVRIQRSAVPIDGAAQLEATILQAAARIEVIACDTIEEFEGVPKRLATVSSSTSLSGVVRAAAAAAGGGGVASCTSSYNNLCSNSDSGAESSPAPTPLLIVEGLGATSWMGLRERICSESCSLRTWVLQAISALNCAVVILDATYDSHGKMGSGHVNWAIQDTDDVIYNCYTFKQLSSAVGPGSQLAATFRPSRVSPGLSFGGVAASSAQLSGDSAVLTTPRPGAHVSSLLSVPAPTALTLKFVLFTAACKGPGGSGHPEPLNSNVAPPSLSPVAVHRHLLFMFRCESKETRSAPSPGVGGASHSAKPIGSASSRCTVVPLGVAEYVVDAHGASLRTTT